MVVKYLYGLLFSSLLLVAGCSDCSSGTDYPIAEKLDSISYNNEKYYLYIRTFGFQEKVSYFELYKNLPDFDSCGKSVNNLIYTIDYDDFEKDQYVKSLSLDLDSPEKLKIIYTEDREKGFSGPYSVKFSPLPKP